MISSLRPYPAMRDSAVEWLGDIPEHWSVRRLRSATSILNGATPSTSRKEYWDGDLLWLTPEDLGALQGPRVTDSARKITTEGHASCGTSLAVPNSIAMSTRAPIGHLGILTSAGCTNQGCKLLVPNSDIVPEYLYRLLESTRSELESLGQGTTFSELSRAKLGNFRLSVPPLSEQTAIVRFLDHADQRIRRYIRAKEKLIVLLEEQKQTVIHHAVTGRIDVRTGEPYPAYKPSGVKWLGDVPAHWEVRKLGQFGRLSKGNGGSKEDETSEGISCVRYGDLYTTHTFAILNSRSCIAAAKAKDYTPIKFGDVLFAASGETIEEIGKSAVNLMQGETVCGGDIILFRSRREVDARYLGYVTDCHTAANQKAIMGRGITVMHIYGTQLKYLTLPLAPFDEQATIARFLDQTIDRIESCIASTQSEIDLLHEYRTRLIADVVTGKLDVREAAALLPEIDPLTTDDAADDLSDTGKTRTLDSDREPAEVSG